MWMNEYDVEDACAMWANHPTLGPATQTLRNLVDMTNHNSDGWPYWKKPANAAKKLMELIQTATNTKRGWGRYDTRDFKDPTAAEIRKAYAPIKAFITRMGGGNFAIEFIEPRSEVTV